MAVADDVQMQELDFLIGTEDGVTISFVNQMNLIYTGPVYFSNDF